MDTWLFSYGTLRQPDVQRAVFGREIEGSDDALVGFELDFVEITDAAVIAASGTSRHPILKRGDASSTIPGQAFALSPEDLAAADRYESSAYMRVPVVLASGRAAEVYVQRERASK